MVGNAAIQPELTKAIETRAYYLSDLPSLETALCKGLLQDWRGIVAQDPIASLFQTPGWCMPWYRCYKSTYDPYVIVVTASSGLVGIVPMAVHRETGEFAFASNTMADYRDIVALPGYRAAVVSELIQCYLSERFSNPLEVGWMDPASDTPALIADICRSRGLHYIVRHQPCWRWFPPPPPKPSAQKFLNWYKRQGTVTFEVIDSAPAWLQFREEYYRQHSLRQIQAGRQTSFEDSRKAALYEEMFHSTEVRAHVSGFYVNGKMLAGHFGHVWRDVLLLGPPSIRLEDEQRSPAVILFAWIIQNAAELGLAGFDLTIGDSDFKKRLGNQCVELTAVDIYAHKRSYYLRAARTGLLSKLKKAIGEDTWKTNIKPVGAWLHYKRQRIAEMGAAAIVGAALRTSASVFYERQTEVVYSATRETLRRVAPKLKGDEVHDNRIEDLLLWQGTSPSVSSALTACARSYARIRNLKHTLHTVVVSDALAGWCYSYTPEPQEQEGSVALSDAVRYQPGSAVAYGVYALPGFREVAVYEALVGSVAQSRMEGGATQAYVISPGADRVLRSAIEALGFRAAAVREHKRLFRTSSSTVTEHAGNHAGNKA